MVIHGWASTLFSNIVICPTNRSCGWMDLTTGTFDEGGHWLF